MFYIMLYIRYIVYDRLIQRMIGSGPSLYLYRTSFLFLPCSLSYFGIQLWGSHSLDITWQHTLVGWGTFIILSWIGRFVLESFH